MASNSTRISDFQQKTIADPSDMVLAFSAVSNADVITPVANLFSKVGLSANGVITPSLIITSNNTPANSTANVAAGTIWADSYYIYVAVANNNIKRTALTSF